MIKRSQPVTLKHLRVQRLALEPRIVFDGALPVAGIDAMDHNADHGVVAPAVVAPVQRDTDQAKPSAPAVTLDKAIAPGNDAGSTHEIIFVDASVDGLQALLNQHQQAEVIVLDPHRDGVEQIAAALAGRTGIDAIHILSHGDAGKLHLGDATLDQQGINGRYADDLATIRSALNGGADILIYGCDVAAGSKGQAFVTALAAATGADIAASTNSTGALGRGGDWVLESTTGSIETTALALVSFDGLLTTAPTIADSVTTPRTTTEDTPLVINGLTVADADNPASARATLTVTGGTVAVNAAGGGTITGNGTNSITVTGTVSEINARINGMSFTPTLNQNTGIAGYVPRVDISVSDLTNTDGPTVLSITNLVVTPVNDAPTLTGGTGASVGEGGTLNFLAATTAGQGFIQSQLGLADVDNLAVQVIVKLAGLPAHGTLKLSGNTIAVGSTFSVADINNLSYTHDGTQVTSTTTDTFLVTIDDGAGGLLTNRSVNITITPVNQPPSVSGSITVIEGETGVRLDNNGLLPTVAIPRGAIVTGDPEGAPISSYNITSLPGHGTLFYNGVAIVSASPASPFVVTDITKLTYSHDGSNFAADSFNLSVTDDGGGTGVSATTPGTINLAIYPNDDDPVLTTNVTQTLGAGTSSRTITPAMLRVTDSDSPDSTLTYTLTSVPAAALGYFRLSGQTLVAGATFTQADIAAGNLVYVTLSNTARTDSISFTVKDGGVRLFPDVRDGGIYNTLAQNSPLTVNTFRIIIPNTVTPDPAPVPGNTPANTVPVDDGAKAVTLLESQTVTLTNAMLHATDADNTPAQLVYRLASLPASGSVTLNGAALLVDQSFTQADVNSGLVRFANAGNEKFFDTFTYTVSDGQAVTAVQTFSITVTPQNDTPSATTAGRLVAEGGSFAVTAANIALSDADTVADSTPGSQYANNNVLRFRITGAAAHGTLRLNGVAAVAGIEGVGTEVTSAQLAAGNLVYTHDGSETFTDSFKLVPIDNQGITAATATATNQISTGTEVTVPIFITPVNNAPVKVDKYQLIASESGAIQEGTTAVIGGATGYSIINGVAGSGTPTFNAASAHLVFSDTDNSSVQRQYRIVSAPVNGQLLLNGAGLGVGSIFTQADLDSGRISYKHSGTETSNDSFGYVVSDGDWTVNDTTAFAQGGPAATSSTYLIEITPLNDLPTLVTPASIDAFAAGAGTTAIIGVALTDADLAALRPGETDFVRAEVKVLDSGNAAVAAAVLNYGAADPAGGSAFFFGKGSNSLIVQGTKAQVDAILASLTVAFSADADASNYKIRVTVDDRLYDSSGALTTGANGGPGPVNVDGTAINAINNRVTKDIVLRASNFNDVPTIATPASYIVNEDALVSLSGVTLADADSFGDVTATVSLYNNAGRTTLASNGTEGRLILGATTGLTSSSGNNTSTITLVGSIANVQAALNALQFAGAPDYNGTGVGNGSLYLRTVIADFAHADGQKTATADSTISIVPVNDQPNLTVPGTQTLSSGTSIAITSGFAVDDLKDTSQGATNYLEVTVAATLGVTPYGTITFTASGSAIIVGNAGSTVVVKGTALDVQNTLNSMVYTPVSSNANQTIVITTTVDDRVGGVGLGNGAEGTGVGGNNTRSATFNINVSSVNEAPVATAPATLTVNEDSTNNLVAGISIADTDDFGSPEKVTLDLGASAKGTISLGVTAGLTFSTGSTGVTLMTFTGSKANINAALASLTFTPTGNINTVGGGNEQSLIVTVDDQGNTGAGGALTNTKTVLITITPVNDAPTRTAASATLTAVLEDAPAAGAGTPPGAAVSTLFGGLFSDSTDGVTGGSIANTFAGVAIVGNASTAAQGKWQYDSGSGFVDLPPLSLTSPFLLKPTDTVRFLPLGNWNGTPGQLTVRLIDSSSGAVTTGSRPDLSSATATGGTTAYSSLGNAVTLNTSITAVNDAPLASGAATLAAINEDTVNPSGATISALITGANYSDVTDTVPSGSTATALGGIAIVGNSANALTQGAWQYSTNGGTSWTAVPTSGLADTTALVLPSTASTQLRFVPVANYNGAPGSLSVRLADSAQLISTSSDISLALGGTNTWSAASILISTAVSPVNDAPVIANAGSTQGYVENAVGTVLEPALTLADVDDTQLNQATIAIGGFVAGDRLNFTNQAGITGSYNPVAGVLTLTGTATSASYQAALRTITFDSTSDNPGSGARTISWTVRDVNSEGAANGQQTSNVANTTVNVTPVNDAPAITGLDVTSTSTYVEKGPAVQIDSNALLADPELDASTWNGATLTLARQGGDNAEDVFSGVAGLSLSGGNVVQEGTTVGSFTQSGGTLVITFNTNATAARVDSVMQGLAYSNSSANPPSSVTITYSVDDQNSNITGGGTAGTGSNQGNGGKLLDSGKIIINITPVNDAPVANADVGAVLQDATLVASAPNGVIQKAPGTDTDLDNTTASLVVSGAVAGAGAVTQGTGVGSLLTGSYGHLTLNADGSYSYVADTANALPAGVTATDVFTYTVKDPGGLVSNTTTLTITVTGTNDAPVANPDTAGVVESGVNPGNTAFAGTPVASGNVLSNDTDPDALDTKTVSAVAGAAGNVGAVITTTYGTVRINADGSYSYTLDNTRAATQALAQGQTATETFSYTVKDTAGATSSSTLTVTVTGTNDAPVANPDSAATPLNVPLNNINVKGNDTDVDNTPAQLTVSAPVLANPALGSVTLNGDGTLNFTPALGVTGPVLINYTLTDAFGASSTGTVTVRVTADFMDQRIGLERSDAVIYSERGDLATYRRTAAVLPVHAEPALFVLQSVSEARNEISMRSGIGNFQADNVTQAELLGSVDADNMFASGAQEGPGGLTGRDFSPLRPLYRSMQDQPNALSYFPQLPACKMPQT